MVRELDLGTRKVSKMNFSNIVALPHIFVDGFIGEKREVKCILDANKGILKLIPIKAKRRKYGYLKGSKKK